MPLWAYCTKKQKALHKGNTVIYVGLNYACGGNWSTNIVFSAVLLAGSLQGFAQDRRVIVEPHIPPACTQLTAVLKSVDGDLMSEDETRLDTARLQQALNSCGPGHAVALNPGNGNDAFLSGPVSIPAGVTLLVEKGVILFASRDPALYAVNAGSCGVVNDQPAGCRPLLAVDHAPHAGVMGEGTIDGRGGDTLLHGTATWWQLAEQARAGGRQQVPRLLVVSDSNDFTAYRITLKNSANFHLVYSNGQGFTAWGVRIDTPRKARNTDGIDPGSASDITIAHSYISTGDDHIAIKGSGTGVQHMSVLDNHFYFGHGMSIGSETFAGVSDILVRRLSIDGADNGLRIKSNVHRGGLVERVTYEDVCIRNTANPLVMDTRYDNPGAESNLIPLFRNVLVHDVSIAGGGKLTIDGQDSAHRTETQLDQVRLDNPSGYQFFAKDAAITYGPGAVNFRMGGEDVSAVRAAQAKDEGAISCADRFPLFPR